MGGAKLSKLCVSVGGVGVTSYLHATPALVTVNRRLCTPRMRLRDKMGDPPFRSSC